MEHSTEKIPVKLSQETRRIISTLPCPLITMKRIVEQHPKERFLRRLWTPGGPYTVTLSFHRVWDQTHAATLVLVQSLSTNRYALYTQDEVKAIIQESLLLRNKSVRKAAAPTGPLLHNIPATSPTMYPQAPVPVPVRLTQGGAAAD